MERCPKCGNKLSNIDVLCPRCGTVVEVIQIKNNISSDAAASTVAKDSKPKIKDFPQSFIVYNEDFPSDAEANESREENAVLNTAGGVFEATDPISPIADTSPVEPDAPHKYSPDASAAADDKAGVSVEPGADDNDYSPRYLENLMNINLPEIDDLQDFDPDEFMREYMQKKQSSSPDEPVPQKRWIEIEEADTSETAPKDSTDSQLTERRYRSSSQPIIREQPKEKSRKREPRKMSKSKKNIALSVLLWVLVAGALFFSFIYFDKYVQKAYGNYDNLIYSITNGKVDLSPQD
ncbi:MAG: hypothetical protein ACM3S4_03390 [Burkholderiales bacterium]